MHACLTLSPTFTVVTSKTMLSSKAGELGEVIGGVNDIISPQ